MTHRIHCYRALNKWFVSTAFVLLKLTSALGQDAVPCQIHASDTSFAAPAFFAAGVHETTGTPNISQPVTIQITRVVGPGTNLEFDSQTEFLANWPAYVANGVLSGHASLYINDIGVVDGINLSSNNLTVYVNGQPQKPFAFKAFTGGFIWSACIEISTEFLKFPHRAANGSSPVAAMNSIAFTIDTPEANLRAVHPGASAGTLSFKAMAPIVLVHGWNSGPWQWGPETPDPSGVCGAGQSSSDKGRATINTLVTAKVPFDCSIKIDRQASIDDGAQVLLSGHSIEPISPSVAGVVAQFGSRHVHIVTNSKGGLFTRAYLESNAGLDPNSQTGIISVTTLDTPHQGSVLSDTVYAYNSGVRSVLGSWGNVGYFFGRLFTRARIKNSFGTGNDDMTVARMATFNAAHSTPHAYHIQIQDQSGNVSKFIITKSSYQSTSANADLNGDNQLQDNEAAPYTALVARFQWNRIRKVRSITVGKDPQGRTVATFDNFAGFLDNDTAVSIDSARHPDFRQINSYRANHASILCPATGAVPGFCAPIASAIVDVLARIRLAEQVVNEQIQ